MTRGPLSLRGLPSDRSKPSSNASWMNAGFGTSTSNTGFGSTPTTTNPFSSSGFGSNTGGMSIHLETRPRLLSRVSHGILHYPISVNSSTIAFALYLEMPIVWIRGEKKARLMVDRYAARTVHPRKWAVEAAPFLYLGHRHIPLEVRGLVGLIQQRLR